VFVLILHTWKISRLVSFSSKVVRSVAQILPLDHTSEISVVHCRAVVGLKKFSLAEQQIETVDEFRAIAAKHADLGIVTFSIMWMFVDQYEQVLPNTLQEIYSCVGFMVLIAAFFIPSLQCTLWVALAILSIDAGVFGFMPFMDINIDTVSMVTVIMSIGFSVDFTAHIAYAYVAQGSGDQVERTVAALGALAWPITQGALSTILGVSALAGTSSYITRAFFRTVFLVMTIGYAHAIVFLPIALSELSLGRISAGLACRLRRAKPERDSALEPQT